MEGKLARLQELLVGVDRMNLKGRGYPAEVRRLTLEIVEAGLAAGWTWEDLSRRTTVGRARLREWYRRSLAPAPSEAVIRPVGPLVPVQIVDDGSGAGVFEPSSVSVVAPNGWRIEGLTLAQAATLLASVPS